MEKKEGCDILLQLDGLCLGEAKNWFRNLQEECVSQDP